MLVLAPLLRASRSSPRYACRVAVRWIDAMMMGGGGRFARVPCVGGLMEEEAHPLLQDFVAKRRTGDKHHEH